ncbi:hypothetical protein D3C81_1555560 [compost metagenome]
MGFRIQTNRGFVHLKPGVEQVAAADLLVRPLSFALILYCLQPTGWTFQEMRQRPNGKFLHHRLGQAVTADVRRALSIRHRLKFHRFEGEIRWRHAIAQPDGFLNAALDLLQHPRRQASDRT